MYSFDAELFAKIAAPILSLLFGALIKRYFKERSKLITFMLHASQFTVGEVVVNTHSIILRNTGNKAASNVRVHHQNLPPNIQVYPPIHYTVERRPDQSGDIVFSALVPKEQVTISYLYYPPLFASNVNSGAKSDDGLAKIINAIPMQQPHPALLFVVGLLMFVGGSTIIYWSIQLIIFLLLKS